MKNHSARNLFLKSLLTVVALAQLGALAESETSSEVSFREAEKRLEENFEAFRDDQDLQRTHGRSGMFSPDADAIIRVHCESKLTSNVTKPIYLSFPAEIHYSGKGQLGIVKLVSRSDLKTPTEWRTKWQQNATNDEQVNRTKMNALFIQGETLESASYLKWHRRNEEISRSKLTWSVYPVKQAGTLDYVVVLTNELTVKDAGSLVEKFICQ